MCRKHSHPPRSPRAHTASSASPCRQTAPAKAPRSPISIRGSFFHLFNPDELGLLIFDFAIMLAAPQHLDVRLSHLFVISLDLKHHQNRLPLVNVKFLAHASPPSINSGSNVSTISNPLSSSSTV